MAINFDATYKLCDAMLNAHFITRLKIFEYGLKIKKERPDFYNSLVDLQMSKLNDEEKYKNRLLLFSKEYYNINDPNKGEAIMLFCFDQNRIGEKLSEVYWKIQTAQIFKDNSNKEFDNSEAFERLLNKAKIKELYIDQMVYSLNESVPTIKDIENEFWNNCMTLNDIDKWCNLYYEKFKNVLYDYGYHHFEIEPFMLESEPYLKELRKIGVLSLDRFYFETRLCWIVGALLGRVNSIIELFKSLRQMTAVNLTLEQSNSKNVLVKDTLTNFNLLLKELKRLDLITDDCYFVPNVGKIKIAEAPEGLEKSFKKVNLISVVPTEENFLRELQSDAINEIMMLSKEQLENCLNRLNTFDTFSAFYKFWGSFYVKFVDNQYDHRDLLDLKMTLEGYFSVNYPENAEVDLDFIHDLQDDIFLKNGVLHGLICQIEHMANSSKEILNRKSKEIMHSKVDKIRPNSLQDIFNEPYKNKYRDFLRLLNTAVPDVLNEDLKYINKNGNVGFIGQYFIALKEKGIVNIKVDHKEHSLFISNNINGMRPTSDMLHNKGNQKYNNNEAEIERQLEILVKSITK